MNTTPEPCPECGGKCCRDMHFSYRVEHMGAECYEHVCDYCRDGTRHVPPRTAEEERADVVAWLRDVAETMNRNGDKCCGRVEGLADAVERGEHRREEEP